MEEIIFPNQIRMIRRTRGKTMKEIAGILGVSLSAISKIEKGYRRIDEEQLDKISSFLDCPKESIFVYEKTSQPEVLQAWQKEQDRRKQINEKSGLKTLGAGLRYIRGEKMLTLQDVAKGAGLTLSVYHRIEMGQREVTEEQFKKIAHALGFTTETLQIQIYELDMAGTLQEFKKTGKPGIFHPKGGYNDLPLKSLNLSKKILVHNATTENGTFVLKEQTSEMEASLPWAQGLKGIKINAPLPFGNFSATYILASDIPLEEEAPVLFEQKENTFLPGTFSKQQGKIVFKAADGTEQNLTESDLKKLSKIVALYF